MRTEPTPRPGASANARSAHPGLLTRPPATFREPDPRWVAMLIDPAAQVRALAQLVSDGLLTSEEFDRAKQRALRWSHSD